MSSGLSFNLLSPSELKPLSVQREPQLPVQSPQFSRVSSLLARQDSFQPRLAPATSLQNPLSLFSRAAVTPAAPAVGLAELRYQAALQNLQTMPPEELKKLGQQDKKSFFAALLPAAIDSEKKYGVPAEVTLAQAALESGWARSPIGGYNIFGIKGKGSQGSVNVSTREFYNGRYVTIRDNFARYANFYDAVSSHGKLFHNGYYDKAIHQYSRDKNPDKFVDNIHGIYATDPDYSRKIKGIIADYGLKDMVNRTGMV